MMRVPIRRERGRWTATCAVLLLLAGITWWQRREATEKLRQAPQQIIRRAVKQLASSDRERREEAYKQVSGVVDDLNAVLTNTVRGRGPPYEWRDPVELAARLIAKLHERGTVAALVENVEWRTGGISRFVPAPYAGYPCAEALVQVGQSSVPEILRYLQRTKEAQVPIKPLCFMPASSRRPTPRGTAARTEQGGRGAVHRRIAAVRSTQP